MEINFENKTLSHRHIHRIFIRSRVTDESRNDDVLICYSLYWGLHAQQLLSLSIHNMLFTVIKFSILMPRATCSMLFAQCSCFYCWTNQSNSNVFHFYPIEKWEKKRIKSLGEPVAETTDTVSLIRNFIFIFPSSFFAFTCSKLANFLLFNGITDNNSCEGINFSFKCVKTRYVGIPDRSFKQPAEEPFLDNITNS